MNKQMKVAILVLACGATASAVRPGLALAEPEPSGVHPPQLEKGRIAFAPDGSSFVVLFYAPSKTRREGTWFSAVFDTTTAKALARIPTPVYLIPVVGPFHPNSKSFLVHRSAKKSALWDYIAKKEVLAFEPDSQGHDRPMAFSPDGAFAFGMDRDIDATQWDAKTGKVVREFDLPMVSFPLPPRLCCFSEDGKRVIRVSQYSIDMWDMTTGKRAGPFFADYTWLQQDNPHTPFCCSLTRRYACTVRDDHARIDPRLRVWDLNEGKLVKEYSFTGDSESYVQAASFADGDRTLLAVSGRGGSLYAWDVKSGKHLWKMELPRAVYAAGFSNDGRLLLTNGVGRTNVCLWDTEKRKLVWSKSLDVRAD